MYPNSTMTHESGSNNLNMRYVAYDVQTNSAVYPPAVQAGQHSSFPQAAASHTQPPFAFTMPLTGLNSDVAPVHSVQAPPVTTSPGIPNSQKLLGNKQIKPVAELSGYDLHAVVHQSSPHVPKPYNAAAVQRRSSAATTMMSNSHSSHHKLSNADNSRSAPDFDPHEVITASSSSNAVL